MDLTEKNILNVVCLKIMKINLPSVSVAEFLSESKNNLIKALWREQEWKTVPVYCGQPWGGTSSQLKSLVVSRSVCIWTHAGIKYHISIRMIFTITGLSTDLSKHY